MSKYPESGSFVDMNITQLSYFWKTLVRERRRRTGATNYAILGNTKGREWCSSANQYRGDDFEAARFERRRTRSVAAAAAVLRRARALQGFLLRGVQYQDRRHVLLQQCE